MKYIVFENGGAVLFGNELSHKDVAGNRRVKSAGFCVVETGRNSFDDIVLKTCSCFGYSESLGVEAHPCEDEQEIARVFIGMN